MSKYRRNRDGQVFFCTVVTNFRKPILTTETGRRCLREAIDSVRIDRPFKIVAFVLLRDHLHTIWELPTGDSDYSTRWRLIKKKFTQAWLANGLSTGYVSASRISRGEKGIWQRRFFEHTCRNDADLKRCVDYVHVNPLKHSLVKKVKDWPWSTFHRYVIAGEYTNDWGSSNIWYGDEFLHFE